jgi:hypothetical protein
MTYLYWVAGDPHKPTLSHVLTLAALAYDDNPSDRPYWLTGCNEYLSHPCPIHPKL